MGGFYTISLSVIVNYSPFELISLLPLSAILLNLVMIPLLLTLHICLFFKIKIGNMLKL